MKGETRKRILSVVISLAIIFGIMFAGPASAVTLHIHSPSSTSITEGDVVTFIVEVDVENNERIPVRNLSLKMHRNGTSQDSSNFCVFNTAGTSLVSGDQCDGLTITPIGSRPVGYGYNSSMYGYGYGYAISTGYANTSFGSGYGYGYQPGYGYGYSSNTYHYSELAYQVTWNTSAGWEPGVWDIDFYANVVGSNGQHYQFRTTSPLTIDVASSQYFSFAGYTYDTSKNALNGTNVTVQVLTGFNPGARTYTYSTLSNESGFFNISNITYNDRYMYKPVVIKFNDTKAQYIGQTLPYFPGRAFSNLGMINFYLKEGATINITAYNVTGDPVSFSYMIKDTLLGYPISENFDTSVQQATVYLPADRNYSIMMYPDMSMPVAYDLNNISDYTTPKYIPVAFNTTTLFKWTSGYATLANGSSDFSNFGVIPYIVEADDMVSSDHPMPYNMSAWRQYPASDQFNETNGFFNLTLPGAAMGSNILLFATANRTDGWYGGFRLVSLNASSSDISGYNITMYKLVGDNETTIELQNPTSGGTTGINTLKKRFKLQNSTYSSPDNAHIEFEVNYPEANFTWMIDTQRNANGTFAIPVLNKTVKKVSIYSADFAPLKTKLTTANLVNDPINITLTSFKPEGVGGEDFTDYLKISLIRSSASCDVPNPPQACMMMNNEMNMTNFNPLTVVMGGGDLSFRMRLTNNNITVHYKNVDMIASGPPDALFDSAANESSSGSSVEAAWRFGSKGPEIYDKVLIGIPYNESSYNESGTFTMKIEKFYDEDWNVIWQLGVNTTAQIPSDYNDYLSDTYSDYLSSSGMTCSKTNETATCYVNTTSNMVWFWIPHFSGIGPLLSGSLISTTPVTNPPSTTTGGGTVQGTPSPVVNVESATKATATLESANAGETKTFDVSGASKLPISNIDVKFKNGVSSVELTTEAVDSLPAGTPALSIATGSKVYSYIKITTTVSNDDIDSASIKFKVPKSWFTENGLDETKTTLGRYNGSVWSNLSTTKTSEDSEYYYFEATTPGFSVFAVFAEPIVAHAASTTTTTTSTTTILNQTETTTVQTTTTIGGKTKESNGMIQVIVAIIIIIIVLLLGYLYYKKKPSKQYHFSF